MLLKTFMCLLQFLSSVDRTNQVPARVKTRNKKRAIPSSLHLHGLKVFKTRHFSPADTTSALSRGRNHHIYCRQRTLLYTDRYSVYLFAVTCIFNFKIFTIAFVFYQWLPVLWVLECGFSLISLEFFLTTLQSILFSSPSPRHQYSLGVSKCWLSKCWSSLTLWSSANLTGALYFISNVVIEIYSARIFNTQYYQVCDRPLCRSPRNRLQFGSEPLSTTPPGFQNGFELSYLDYISLIYSRGFSM